MGVKSALPPEGIEVEVPSARSRQSIIVAAAVVSILAVVQVKMGSFEFHVGAHPLLGGRHGAVVLVCVMVVVVIVVAIVANVIVVAVVVVVSEDGGDGAATRSGSLKCNSGNARIYHAIRMR